MSINFHAYQCRGYLLSDYEEIEKQWKTLFANYAPERDIRILNLKRDEQYLYIRYFQTLYRLHLKNGTLERQLAQSPTPKPSSTGHSSANTSSYVKVQSKDKLYLNPVNTNTLSVEGWTTKVYFNEAMAIYHLLHYVKDHAYQSGIWIPNTELDTRSHRNNQREDLLFASFTRQFSGKLDKLSAACRKLNGTPLQTRADVAYQFSVFPQVSLQLLFWDADEDFPAQVQILVDKRITDYVHLETTGCMVSDLFEQLTAALTPEQNQ